MIPKDKILHLVAGFLISVVFSYMAYLQGFDYPQSYGVVLGVCAGLGKEAFDYYDYGKADFYDMMATFIGVFIGGGLVVVLV